MFFLNKIFKKKNEVVVSFLKELPFLSENERTEEICLQKFPIDTYKNTFKTERNFHKDTYNSMNTLVYYASVWLELGCPFYTEEDLISYFGTSKINSNTYSLLNNIRALYIATPPLVYYDDKRDCYSVFDGRHRIIALDEASKKLGLPVKLPVFNGVKDKEHSNNISKGI